MVSRAGERGLGSVRMARVLRVKSARVHDIHFSLFFPSLHSYIVCIPTFMLSDNIYDLDCFNERTSDALPSGRYPLLDDVDLTGEDASDCSRDPEDSEMRTLHAPRPQLRSRPPIDFYGKNSVTNYTPSFMSGSTLHTNTFTYPPKIIDTSPSAFSDPPQRLPPSAIDPPQQLPPSGIDPPQWLPPSVIAALTISELCFNPHYCELRERYDYVSEVLASYMDREKPTKGKPVLDNCRRVCFLFLRSSVH